jgi:FMN phosphatase YigB (HAD superfamily)
MRLQGSDHVPACDVGAYDCAVPVRAVFFDVGETLVNESSYWSEYAEQMGISAHVLWAAVGATIERGEHHRDAFTRLGFDFAQLREVVYRADSFYPDALPCLEELGRRGYVIGIVGNQTVKLEQWLRAQDVRVDVIGSSASWGVEKPALAFFERVVAEAGYEPRAVAYVGDRVDNDVVPAMAAGLVAVHVRRGPWGYLQRSRERATICVDALAELPDALERV